VLLLETAHRLTEIVHQMRVIGIRHEIGRQIGGRQQRTFAEDGGALQRVVQLAHVALPRTSHQ
jgi:hypothetical protein